METEIFDFVNQTVCEQNRPEEVNPSENNWLKSQFGLLYRFANGEDSFTNDGSGGTDYKESPTIFFGK